MSGPAGGPPPTGGLRRVRGRRGVLVAGLVVVLLAAGGAAGVLATRGPASCGRAASVPDATGESVTAVVGSQPAFADGVRVGIGDVSDDGCSVHLGVSGEEPGWVEIGGTTPAAAGSVTVVSVRRAGEQGATADEVTLRYAP